MLVVAALDTKSLFPLPSFFPSQQKLNARTGTTLPFDLHALPLARPN
jgi:hypothetical protein